MPSCQNCGLTNTAGVVSCQSCGARLIPATYAPFEPVSPFGKELTNRQKMALAATILGTILIVVFLFLLF